MYDIKQQFDAVDTDVSSLESYISAEVVSLEAIDTGLAADIATEKGRIDAILEASTTDADQFAEVVSLINSVDTENDDAFAGYVTSNNASIDSLEAVDVSLQSQITSNDGDITSLDTRVTADEAALAEETRRALAAEEALESALAAEIAATNADFVLDRASIDSLEVAVEQGATYLRQTAVFSASNLFTIPMPVLFGANDDLAVYVNGVFVDFRCTGQEVDFTGLLAYNVDANDKVQVMGIKA